MATNGNTTILVAQEFEMNMLLVTSLLKKILPQAKITQATDGLQVLEHCKSSEFDLILMDVQMPEMDGLKATEAIRLQEKKSGKHIPILAQTAGALNEEKEKCLAGGMDDFLTKPIDYEKLEVCLKKYL